MHLGVPGSPYCESRLGLEETNSQTSSGNSEAGGFTSLEGRRDCADTVCTMLQAVACLGSSHVCADDRRTFRSRTSDASAVDLGPVSDNRRLWACRSSAFHSTRVLRRLKLHPWPDRLSDPDFEVIAGEFQVVMRLQIQPPLGLCSEIPGELQGGVGADGSLAADDLANPERRHSPGFREGVLSSSWRMLARRVPGFWCDPVVPLSGGVRIRDHAERHGFSWMTEKPEPSAL